jgi:CRP-like cAMP-binding protein
MYRDEEFVKTIGEGDLFGELAIINDAQRAKTVIAIQNSLIWGLERKVFQSILRELNSTNYEENKSFINHVPLFNSLNKA